MPGPPRRRPATSMPNARCCRPTAATTWGKAPTTVSTVQFDPDTRLPLAGTILVREYKGRKLQVRVLESGFEFEGEVYRSLSAVAKKITGSHCNGYLFFHLKREA